MKKILLLGIILMAGLCCVRVYGQETKPQGYGSLSDYDFNEIDDIIDEYSSEFDFDEMVQSFFNGDINGSLELLGSSILNYLFGELSAQKKIIIKIIVIGVAAAVFTNIAGTLMSGGLSETGFYVTYIMLIGTLTAGYIMAATVVKNALNALITLMDAVTPVYVLSLGFASGGTSATGFYQIIVMVITIIENVLLKIIIPTIYIFMIIGLINNFTEGGIFTKALELMKTVIEWVLKALMSVVIGINIVQSLISPVMNSIRTTALGKAVSAIPGVGGVLTSVSGIILGSGTLIKNAIGMASMVAIVVVSFIPVIKTVIMSLSYKAAGAVLEPISDKRIINAVNGIYESIILLTKTLLYAVVFFLLTVAIICSSTNWNAG